MMDKVNKSDFVLVTAAPVTKRGVGKIINQADLKLTHLKMRMPKDVMTWQMHLTAV